MWSAYMKRNLEDTDTPFWVVCKDDTPGYREHLDVAKFRRFSEAQRYLRWLEESTTNIDQTI